MTISQPFLFSEWLLQLRTDRPINPACCLLQNDALLIIFGLGGNRYLFQRASRASITPDGRFKSFSIV
jgi:hypothetical protein